MFVVGVIVLAAAVVLASLARHRHRNGSASMGRASGVILVAFTVVAAAVPLALGGTASALIVPTVGLATADDFSVLAGSTVTNTGASVLEGSLGLAPGTSVIGFPPGIVLAPSTIEIDNAVADQAQLDLIEAYDDAAGRPVDVTTVADLTGLTLVGGVYAADSHGPLGLTGPLTLDGEGDPLSVFIFQTDSTLITGSSASVNLINGAQQCNVFWQVGSSATLGTGSSFVGTILALTSITVNNGVTIAGRALARNGAVTLDDDVFTSPGCDLTPTTTSSTTSSSTTSTTEPTTTSTSTTSTTVPTTTSSSTSSTTSTSSTSTSSTSTTSTTLPTSTTTSILPTSTTSSTLPTTTTTSILPTSTTSSTLPTSTTSSTSSTLPTSTTSSTLPTTTTTAEVPLTSTTSTTGVPGSSTSSSSTSSTVPGSSTSTTSPGGSTTTTPRPRTPTGELPRTGSTTGVLLLVAAVALALGAVAVSFGRTRGTGR